MQTTAPIRDTERKKGGLSVSRLLLSQLNKNIRLCEGCQKSSMQTSMPFVSIFFWGGSGGGVSLIMLTLGDAVPHLHPDLILWLSLIHI